jgi:hypothetical protein
MGFLYKYTFAALMILGIAVSTAQEHPDLGKFESYTEASEIWLGSLVGEVVVNPEFPVEVNVAGSSGKCLMARWLRRTS